MAKLEILLMALLSCALLSATLCPIRGGAAEDRGVDTAAASIIAQAFVEGDETFRYDGLRETLSILPMAEENSEYRLKARFDCSHSGYGDRSGKFLAQAITPHEADIVIAGLHVKSAIMDNRWDMMAEKPI